eukprot:TRINITY_DN112808_c0_g1_i1.p1 TRINITY_DN112808_c0_g1~~TRINITY_DN112808_c0_g1_i1.p1  ORF type:complete len:199 (-),score=33.31 TRINITY_DN112808_c0_g1_i1:25-621(-)
MTPTMLRLFHNEQARICSYFQLIRYFGSVHSRPPGASKASFVPADEQIEQAPFAATRRAGGEAATRPRSAFLLQHTAKPIWRSTRVMGERIYVRQWLHRRDPFEAQQCGGHSRSQPEVSVKGSTWQVTASEARRLRRSFSDRGSLSRASSRRASANLRDEKDASSEKEKVIESMEADRGLDLESLRREAFSSEPTSKS